MYMECVVETIVTLFLLLSRVWARPSNVVCDGGRGEGDKWFDGCRWCVCQRSGSECSSSDCSPLVSRVLPCQKVDSRWWDGCYHCKCYHHGIECKVHESCIVLMRTEQYYSDFLSRTACVKQKDDRCVCGIDGVPSCTAVVIDRNAYPVRTVVLKPVSPNSSNLVVPKVVYYQRPFMSLDKLSGQIRRPEYYSDTYEDDRYLRQTIDQSRLHHSRHSLVKRHSHNSRRHSREFASANLSKKESRKRRKIQSLKNQYLKDSGKRKNKHWPKNARSKTKKSTTAGQFGSKYIERPEVQDKDILEDVSMNDDPEGDNQINRASPSLLIASYNRCWWTSRWYGGSLRCFCEGDNTITCGDPSFVAPSIDGFRLESASCEEGNVWQDQDSCRECKCQINGVALCQRSPSCPLPFLVKPLPMDLDDDTKRDRKELFVIQKGPNSEENTDEFIEQTEQKFHWNGTKKDTKPACVESISSELTDSDLVNKNRTDEVSPHVTIDNNSFFLSTKSDEPEETRPTSPGNILTTTRVKPDRDFFHLISESTNAPNVNLSLDSETTDIHEEEGGSSDSIVTITDENNYIDETDSHKSINNDSKRTTTTKVVVRECKPKSRWFSGCKRCQCSRDGKKYCDDSRCPKPMPTAVQTTNIFPVHNVNRTSRPVQRPPDNFILTRDKPITFNPPFVSCGRFTVGQKYFEECNVCECTSHGPKCTAKNCAL